MAETLTPPPTVAPESPTCLNCGAPLAGPYCHDCGQRDQPVDLTARHMVQEALGHTLSWDGRVFQSLRTLVRRPGLLAEDWAAGRRARHVTPFRLYLMVSLIYVGFTATYALAKDVLVDEVAETAAEDEAQLRESFRKGPIPPDKIDSVAAYTVGVISLGSRWMFILMPLGGFGLYVLYHLRRPSYAAHFVLAIHVFTVVMLMLVARRALQLGVVLVAQERLTVLFHTLNDALLLGVLALATVYAAASIRRFYGVGWAKALASAPAVTVGPLVGRAALFVAGYLVILALP